jgi:hypothetical protein
MTEVNTLTNAWRGWFLSFLIASPAYISVASADPLFSFTLSGTAGRNVISTNLFATVGYRQSPLPPSPPQFTLFDLPWTIGDVGTSRIETSGTTTNFNGFAALMTDGIKEVIVFSPSPGEPSLTGFGRSEAAILGHIPDLFGYQIDSVSLTLNSLSFSTPGSDPNQDGLWTDASFSLTLSGSGVAIPEASSLSLLIIGMLALSMAKLRLRLVIPEFLSFSHR